MSLAGKWSLLTSENINAYLKQLGMALNKRKCAVSIEPVLVISKVDDGVWSIAIDMKNKGTETLFKEGEEIDTSNEMKFVFDSRFYFDSRRMTKSKFKFETPHKLIQKMDFIDTNEFQIITREINQDDQLIETMEMNAVKAIRVYKRI